MRSTSRGLPGSPLYSLSGPQLHPFQVPISLQELIEQASRATAVHFIRYCSTERSELRKVWQKMHQRHLSAASLHRMPCL